uniref:LOW QUALITY PROTEIN: acetyl-CoA carboxylase-like n=1 Tax=Ciona intestinalis TaxID=7719 RepID=UPI000521C57B|nr:LOW QUALITY PROTEIN: acetyl-CoA carboxylase-like [Ciona intestinalis]|eukprot:XP_004227021.2 LOW QUALITY PROTEIN: acetyl-CoA carboxylase-like [Ciona intestinalis]
MTASVIPTAQSSSTFPFSWLMLNKAGKEGENGKCFQFDRSAAATILSRLRRTSTKSDTIGKPKSVSKRTDQPTDPLTNYDVTTTNSSSRLEFGLENQSTNCNKPQDAPEAYAPFNVIGGTTLARVNTERSSGNNEHVETDPHDPCAGLTQLIRKNKRRKRHTCNRCGAALVEATQNIHNVFTYSPKQGDLKKRTQSLNEEVNHTVIYQCSGCRKRYTQYSQLRRGWRKSPRSSGGVRRSMTWPLPMQPIVEEEYWEAECFDNENESTPEQSENASSPTASSSNPNLPSVNKNPMRKQISRKGSSRSVAATMPELVKILGGNNVIEKILLANNEFAPVNCMRSFRRWPYELFRNEKPIHFVAMVTPEDLNANAEYIKMADSYVHVPGGANNNNYANVELILDLARRTAVQAVWAGWGHASENPKLPEMLSKANIAFLGPSASAMWALGDKIASSIVAQTAGVPTLPWSGSGLTVDYTSQPNQANNEQEDTTATFTPIVVPDDIYMQGCVQGVENALQAAQRIGYPVMIKASEGGGGKGIRKVANAEDFPAALRQVQSEVPGSPIFVMKLATQSRHLEVQVLADQYGNAISLFGRDCSIQRRHQKIIEEAPTTVTSEEVWTRMEKDAVVLAKMVGYVSAGTVEYLFSDDGSYHFLELNPRLQVEHPCTEMVADVNLPAAQLQVAMGIPLHRMRDIRILYGEDPWSTNPIDFTQPQHKPEPHGHVIAARITSENPDEGFKPSSGTVQELNFRSNKNVWGYFSVAAAGGLHEFADSQFGHCFAWGENREYAISNMVMALKELSIRGDFRTTVEYLGRLLEDPCFQHNQIDTAWLDALIADKVKSEQPCTTVGLVCCALHIADSKYKARFDFYVNSLERGQVLTSTSLHTSETVELIAQGVKYVLKVTKTSDNSYYIQCNDWNMEVDVYSLSDGGLLLSLDGISRTTYMKEEVDRYRVTINNQTSVFEKENDPSILRGPSAGKLINFIVEDGAHVFAGQTYAEIEVMKMVMSLTAPESGNIHYVKRAGAVLEPGSIIARLTPDDPSCVRRAELFQGQLLNLQGTEELPSKEKSHKIYEVAHKRLSCIMKGLCHPHEIFMEKMHEAVRMLMSALKDPSLPLLELQEVMTNISGRLPAKVEKSIRREMASYASNITSMMSQFPGSRIRRTVDAFAATLTNKSDQDVFFVNTQPILQVVNKYRNGIRGHMKNVVLGLVLDYHRVELEFQHGSFDKSVVAIRDKRKDNVRAVVEDILSHANVGNKNSLIIELIGCVSGRDHSLPPDVATVLEQLALLSKQENSKVALKARQVLIAAHQPPYELRHNQLESIFLSSIGSYGTEFCPEHLKKLILSETTIFDVLPDFFYHANPVVRMAAFEVYVRRSYIAYELNSVQHHEIGEGNCILEFQFMLPTTHPNRFPQNPSCAILSKEEKSMESLHQREYQIPSTSSLPKVASVGEGLNAMDPSTLPPCQRMGIMAAFSNFDAFKLHFSSIMKCFHNASPPDSPIFFDRSNSTTAMMSSCVGSFGSSASLVTSVSSKDEDSTSLCSVSDEPIHILNVAISTSHRTDDDMLNNQFHEFVKEHKVELFETGLRRITFLVHERKEVPKYFTYRARDYFDEDRIYRHLEPALAFQLELNRMRNFHLKAIPTNNHRLHLYLGSAKVEEGAEVMDHRFFVRAIIRHSDLVTKEASFEFLHNEAERLLLEAMDELEVAFSASENTRIDCNHIFMNFVPNVMIDPVRVEESIRSMVLRYGSRLWKLRVLQAEIKVNIRLKDDGEPQPFRIFLTKESGYYLDISLYKEVTNPVTGQTMFQAYNINKPGPLHSMLTSTPYVTKDLLQAKRFKAQEMGTTYVYDFPEMIRQALKDMWTTLESEDPDVKSPENPVSADELVLDGQGQLVNINRQPGENEIGMVSWRLTLYTPEYKDGRQVICIANDITCNIGSFGPEEDLLYQRASELARMEGIPRIYLSANSGARIGLAEEVRHLFRVAWNDPEDEQKGVKYLYLTPHDYKKLSASNSVIAQHIEEGGESRYKVCDVIGKDEALGSRCLRWSGTIAGETSRAYDEIVTISLVTCRAVGIGAYLVRLGQRVIQVDNSYIILTGHQALNKVLGREVYNSNNQLGGIQIMHNNGVSHATVSWDYEGMVVMLKWLSYIPSTRNSPLPIIVPKDPIDREISFKPTRTSYDPRWMLAGCNDADTDTWRSGFFDRGSFDEILSGWANTVIVGRARLGGVPVGVVAVETRSIAVDVPADPADIESEEKTLHRAGQVWYPDSAFKTAQAILDFDREGLPLIMFANWRGFSGGMKDMYDEVLKFGSYIVDALRKYHQPVIVYIPPYAELRGGAWVVVDPTINSTHMELYADAEARGGVLEPEATVEIKYRRKEIIKTMKRCDRQFAALSQELENRSLTVKEKKEIEAKLKERELYLEPVYHQVAVKFADLHDTPGGMLAKGCISGILEWKTSRTYLYWKLRRLILQDDVKSRCHGANRDLTNAQIDVMLRRWFVEDQGTVKAHLWDDNKAVVAWLSEQLSSSKGRSEGSSLLEENIKLLQRDSVSHQIRILSQNSPEVAMHSVVQLAHQMSPEQRQEVIKVLESLES